MGFLCLLDEWVKWSFDYIKINSQLAQVFHRIIHIKPMTTKISNWWILNKMFNLAKISPSTMTIGAQNAYCDSIQYWCQKRRKTLLGVVTIFDVAHKKRISPKAYPFFVIYNQAINTRTIIFPAICAEFSLWSSIYWWSYYESSIS